MVRIVLFIFLFSSFFTVKAQYQHLLHKTYAQRYLAIDTTFYTGTMLGQDSVTFFRHLAAVTSVASEAADEELLLDLKMLQYEYYLFGSQTNHRLFEEKMLDLKQQADRKNIKHLQVKTRQKLGYYYFAVKHKYGPGFENYLSSYQILKDIPEAEMPDKQELIANIGTAYYQFGEIKQARRFLTEAWKVKPSYKVRLQISLTNTLGLIYRQSLVYDSAEYYFRKAYNMAESNKDSTWMGIAAGNIGKCYYSQQKYEKAIPLLKLDISESIKAHEIDNAVSSLITLTKINLLAGDLLKTQNQVRHIQKLLPETNNSYRHLSEVYPLLAKLHALKKDSAKAYLYSDSAQIVKDSLFTRKNSIMTITAERKIEIEKHKAEMDRLEASNREQATLQNGLTGGIILLLIIAGLVINRQKMIYRQKQLQLQNEKNTIASELRSATRQLGDFTNHIREKNKLIEQISEEIGQYKLQYGEPDQQENNEIRDKLIKSTILTDEQWEQFGKLFDTVYVGYLARLREKLPDLSPAGTRYMVLSKLNLSDKEMASMLGVRPDAMRLYRHRLRKRYQIKDDTALHELINSI